MKRLFQAAAMAACLLWSQVAGAAPFRLQASATSITDQVIDGTTMTLTAAGEGKASHMGSIEFTAPHEFDLAAGTYISDAYVTAANGDVLHIISHGQFINAVDSTATWTIVGGTGRFANASGTGTAINLNFGESITFTGSIRGIGK